MSYGSQTVDVAMTQNELQWLVCCWKKKVIMVQKMHLTDGFTVKNKINKKYLMVGGIYWDFLSKQIHDLYLQLERTFWLKLP